MYQNDKKINDQILQHFLNKKAPIVVDSEEQSKYVKKILSKAGNKIISDREVFTLNFYLSLYCSQKLNRKIVDTLIYPLFFNESERPKVKSALNLVNKFPDPFLEKDLFGVLLEYFSEKKEFNYFIQAFKDAEKIVNKIQTDKVIPRLGAQLFLNQVPFSKGSLFCESHLDKLPFSFKEFNKNINVCEDAFFWEDQLDFFLKTKEVGFDFKFKNFNSQIEEVREALRKIKENPQILVLYPKQEGYESLFFLYQKEFFKEQVFYYFESQRSALERVLKKKLNELDVVQSTYSDSDLNPNLVRLQGNKEKVLNLRSFINNLFEKNEFYNFDVNILSSIMSQHSGNQQETELVWCDLILEKIKTQREKEKKLSTKKFLLGDYSFIPDQDFDEIIILGWNDDIFKNSGESFFSKSEMHKMELDLGLQFPSLKSSLARDLFNTPVIRKDKKINVFYAQKNAMGQAKKPGVFKILSDDDRKSLKVPRSFNNLKKENLRKNQVGFSVNSVSASSLNVYDQCSYKYYLEKVLGMSYKEDEDYFYTSLEEGRLMHLLMEELKQPNLDKEKFYQKALETVVFSDEFDLYKKHQAKELIEKLWQILTEEKEYLKNQNLKLFATEKKFEFFVNSESKEIASRVNSHQRNPEGDVSKDRSHNSSNKARVGTSSGIKGIKVKGVIDRVDISGDGQVFLYDYKRKDTGTYTMAGYDGKKLLPQMFLYCLAVDQGFLGEFNKLLGFQFINLTENKRTKGFVLEESGQGFAKEYSKKTVIGSEALEEKITLFLDKFWSVLNRIIKNEFIPRPNHEHANVCSQCHWSGICKFSEEFI